MVGGGWVGGWVVANSTKVVTVTTIQGMVTISRFSGAFSLAGGLNLPKIIECIGSDGQYYKQLVKGKRAPLPASTVLDKLSFTRARHRRRGRFG